ncbi:antitoxin [Caldilinea sp.]|uniref:FitA-like ribbon-helix-helix domain-containing protein n=1 Tax=Caldilinea sp. TaxID=2293560 RepID=UPI002CD59A13|nr:hypothetical protein [Caldilinea sp.]
MTQMTVRGIDEQLHTVLKEMAAQKGVSVNRLVLDALQEAAGLLPTRANQPRRYHDLDDLAGTWSEAEYSEFQATLEQQRGIDSDLW